MKSEVMAKAITGIDDKLITDAENSTPSKRKFKSIYAISAVAAAFVLIFTLVFATSKQSADINLLIDGKVISDSPVEINLPVSVQARAISQSICLDLSLMISEDTNIKVSHGIMNICSSDNTDTQIFTGTEYTADKPVNINWYLDGTDINSVYKLTVNDSFVYSLSYDESTSLWLICKQ